MMRMTMGAVLAACALSAAGLAAQAPAWTATLDGTVDEAEARSPALALPGGGEARLERDGQVLVVRLRTEPHHVASLCIGSARQVAVLHASAALDRVDFTAEGNAWHPGPDTTFEWGMREHGMDDATRAARARYFDEHGWVASTGSMGTPGHREFRIDLSRMPEGADRLAVAFMPAADPSSILSWPDEATGCADHGLVAGTPPARLTFHPERWTALPAR